MRVGVVAACACALLLVAIADAGAPSSPPQQADPAVSPDGKRLAYAFLDRGRWRLAVADRRGRRPRALRPGSDLPGAAQPSWAPDGRSLVFTAGASADATQPSALMVVEASGRNARVLSAGFRSARDPAWSPRADRIAFVGAQDAGGNDLWTIAPDGTALARLTYGGIGPSGPSWAPDGTRIAYAQGGAVNAVDPATGAAVPLVRARPGRSAHSPAWSPDGTTIAFVITSPTAPGGAIHLVSADESAEKRIFSTPFPQASPTWTPDSRTLLFAGDRWRCDRTAVYEYALTTARLQRVTNRDCRIFGRAWSETLRGTRFRDIVYGGGGHDRIFGGGRGGGRGDSLHGGPGSDLIVGSGALYGGPGGDRLRAGSGYDAHYVRDGERDVVLCGGGSDLVIADRRDVARRCGRVLRPK